MENNRYYMDGPGETLIVATDFDASAATPNADKIICVVTSKSSSIGSSVTEEKVTGGRSLAPKRKFPTDRETTFDLEDCEMDFRYVSLSQGEDIVTGATTSWAFGDDYKFTMAATVTLAATPLANTFVLTDEDGNVFTKSATPAAGQYNLNGLTLNFSAGDIGKTGKPVFQYTTAATTKTVSTKNTSIPKTVKLVHRMPMFDNDNDILGYQEIEIFKAQVSGQFEEAFAEKTPVAPKLSFELIDPARADKKLMDHRYIKA